MCIVPIESSPSQSCDLNRARKEMAFAFFRKSPSYSKSGDLSEEERAAMLSDHVEDIYQLRVREEFSSGDRAEISRQLEQNTTQLEGRTTVREVTHQACC